MLQCFWFNWSTIESLFFHKQPTFFFCFAVLTQHKRMQLVWFHFIYIYMPPFWKRQKNCCCCCHLVQIKKNRLMFYKIAYQQSRVCLYSFEWEKHFNCCPLTFLISFYLFLSIFHSCFHSASYHICTYCMRMLFVKCSIKEFPLLTAWGNNVSWITIQILFRGWYALV